MNFFFLQIIVAKESENLNAMFILQKRKKNYDTIVVKRSEDTNVTDIAFKINSQNFRFFVLHAYNRFRVTPCNV